LTQSVKEAIVLKIILETCLMPEVRAFESYNSWWDNNSGGRQSFRSRRPTGIWEQFL